MTSNARVIALVRAIGHLLRNEIPGDIVECGVWRGGSMIAAAMTLMHYGADRMLWLYDTFEGMPPPTEADVHQSGKTAAEMLRTAAPTDWVRAYASLAEVKANLARTGYPESRLRYVQGKVEDTLPDNAPERISLLRLDTDWYESTKAELDILWPRLQRGGVLILDDYGNWAGARKAVDEFFGNVFMDRIDESGLLTIKQ
jgi:O-methyltransferase